MLKSICFKMSKTLLMRCFFSVFNAIRESDLIVKAFGDSNKNSFSVQSHCHTFHWRPRLQTILKGTLGQRTAKTQGCGSALLCGNTSARKSASSCQGNGCNGWTGNSPLANARRYAAARRVASFPPSSRSKILASSSHPLVTSRFNSLFPIAPRVH